jgi:hypothetical protein
VGEFQNPAGRLHDLLSRFAENGRLSTQAAWAAVLEVEEQDVPMYLSDVARLLREVRDAAQETGRDAFDPIPGHLVTLSKAIFPVSEPFAGRASNVAPDPTAMQALKMLSAYLEDFAPDGEIPDELDELLDEVRALMDAVVEADLPVDIRRGLLHRLGDVLAAIEHVKVGGPDDVRRAAEALALSAILYEDDADSDAAVFSRLKTFAKKAWVAFTVTTSLAGAVLTWDKIADLDLLEPAKEQRQLPPPSSPPPDDPSNAADEPGP